MTQEINIRSPLALSYGFRLETRELQAVNALPDAVAGRFCRFFRLDELMHDGTRPGREAFFNVLAAVNEPGFNFVYIIRGDKSGTHIYLGVTAKQGTKAAQSIGDFAVDVLHSSFQGMFRGSRLTPLRETDFYQEIVCPRNSMTYTGMVLGIPSLKEERNQDAKETDFQGIDRLASAMHGETWQMVIVCEPLPRDDIALMRQEVYRLYEELALLARTSVQGGRNTGENTSHNESRSTNVGDTTTVGESHTETQGENESVSYTEGKNTSHSTNSGESVSASHTTGHSENRGVSSGESYSSSTSDTRTKGKSTSENYSHTSRSDNSSNAHANTYSNSTNKGQTHSEGTSSSDTQGKTRNSGTADTEGRSSSSQKGRSTNSSTADGTNTSRAHTTGTTENYGSSTGMSSGKSLTATFEVIHKKEAEELKYIDDFLLPRLQSGESRGMFKTAVFLYAQSPSILARLQSNIRAIFQSETSSFSPLTVVPLADDARWMDDFCIHRIKSSDESKRAVFYGVSEYGNYMDMATCLTLSEVGLMAGLPQYEIPGIPLTPYTSFGLNTKTPSKEGFNLGTLLYGGQAQADNPVQLDRGVLNKHVFVTGITGSGKTMTCKQLLASSQMNFLVVEPAKTEYREILLLSGLDDTLVFTVGDEKHLPLRFNPFELLPGENLTAHIDTVKAAFVSSFHFEASMPQIFEMALYQVYEKKGWDTDIGVFAGNGTPTYPTLCDFLTELDNVVSDQKFGKELEGNYRGSLISRIKNLTYGAKGRMLNCRRSVDFSKLLHRRVVLEMEELKSPQDKALIMALIMGRLAEAVKLEYGKNSNFRHITLVEEAHLLLAKVMPGDDDSKKYSVGVFTDLLAEIRKYGESLIIVDQIPNKLSEDVLKNTATKIVHKLLARDDKEVVGDTMMLDDGQKTFLSNLRTGQAVVFTENWCKAVCTQIDTIRNSYKEDQLAIMRQKNAEDFISRNLPAYCPELGENAAVKDWRCYKDLLINGSPRLFPALRQLLARWKNTDLRRRAFDLLPPPEYATSELASLCARLFCANASMTITLSADEMREMEEIILDMLRRETEEYIEAKHGDTLRMYRRFYLNYFRGKEEIKCLD